MTRTITRSAGSSTAAKMSKAEIIASSVFPQSQEYRMPGEKITLSCQAPAGAKVTVRIGGKTYNMTTSSKSGGLYTATFTYSYTIPSYTGTPRVINLGTPVYTMNYNGTVKSVIAPAKIGAIMKGAPFYAEVKNEDIDTFKTPNSANGAEYELRKGMVDFVTGMTGSYARLASNLWVRKTSISIYFENRSESEGHIGSLQNGRKMGHAETGIPVIVGGNSLIRWIEAEGEHFRQHRVLFPHCRQMRRSLQRHLRKPAISGQYVLALKSGSNIEGYYIEKVSDGIIVHIKSLSWHRRETERLTA